MFFFFEIGDLPWLLPVFFLAGILIPPDLLAVVLPETLV